VYNWVQCTEYLVNFERRGQVRFTWCRSEGISLANRPHITAAARLRVVPSELVFHFLSPGAQWVSSIERARSVNGGVSHDGSTWFVAECSGRLRNLQHGCQLQLERGVLERCVQMRCTLARRNVRTARISTRPHPGRVRPHAERLVVGRLAARSGSAFSELWSSKAGGGSVPSLCSADANWRTDRLGLAESVRPCSRLKRRRAVHARCRLG